MRRPVEKQCKINEKKKERLAKMEPLVPLGGFAKTRIEGEIEESFNPGFIDTIEKYRPIGSGFMKMVDPVGNAYNEVMNYECYEFDEEGCPSPVNNADFNSWYIDHTARLVSERLDNNTGRFWNKWNVGRDVRRSLSRLSVLEERILYLAYGLDSDGKRRTPEEIAALPEFGGDEEYISMVWERVTSYIEKGEESREKFEQLCREHVKTGINDKGIS